MDTKLVEGSEIREEESSSKREGDELEQEPTKKPKVDDDKEREDLQQCFELVTEEDVAINAIPLATMPAPIINFQIHRKGRNGYYEIMRADGSAKTYLLFSQLLKEFDREDLENIWNQLLKEFDREDLENIWKWVKEKHENTRPEEGYERVLWGDLKTMFKHHIEDEVWRSLQGKKEESGLSLIGLCPILSVMGKISKVARKRKVVVGSHGEDPHRKAQRLPTQLSKVVGDASTPLMLIVTPIYMQYLREISIEQLCDIHDKAYLRQAVLDNVLNGRTRKLIYALHKARASCDTIREREIQKYKAYAELEKKCNEALQDLDKTPLVSDMRAEIETLQSRVNDLHRKRLRASEVHILQDVDSLRQDRAALVARVISDQAMKLIRSDEMGVLIARLVKASIIHGRCAAFEEVAELKKPFVLEEMPATVEEATVTSIDIFLQRLRRDALPMRNGYIKNHMKTFKNRAFPNWRVRKSIQVAGLIKSSQGISLAHFAKEAHVDEGKHKGRAMEGELALEELSWTITGLS
ncbi:hypothetical protein Tco_1457235 [Tanacetum coccineum]